MFDNQVILFYTQGVKLLLQIQRYKGGDEMRNVIKEHRESKGISQGKLADLCNVSRQTINAIENNKYDPSLQLAFDLARVLNIRVDELFLDERKDEQ